MPSKIKTCAERSKMQIKRRLKDTVFVTECQGASGPQSLNALRGTWWKSLPTRQTQPPPSTANLHYLFLSEAQSLFLVFSIPARKRFTADETRRRDRNIHGTAFQILPRVNTHILPLFPAQQKWIQTSPRSRYSHSVYLRERKTFRWGVTRLMFGWSSSVSSPAVCFSLIWITSKSLG